MSRHKEKAYRVLFASLIVAGCGPARPETAGTKDFIAGLGERGGKLVFDGDLVFHRESDAREYYEKFLNPAADRSTQLARKHTIWNNQEKLALGYCVSNDFGADKSGVVSAMRHATSWWETVSNVKFHYLPQFDSNCRVSTIYDAPRLFLPVVPYKYSDRCEFHAQAAFPNSGPIDYRLEGRGKRTPHKWSYIEITDKALDKCPEPHVYALPGLLGHEVGHVLGFVHEHLRAGTCADPNYAMVTLGTPYDSASIMHYPSCGGTGPFPIGDERNNMTLSRWDKIGARNAYGALGTRGTTGAFFPRSNGGICYGEGDGDDGFCCFGSWQDFVAKTGKQSAADLWQGVGRGGYKGACVVNSAPTETRPRGTFLSSCVYGCSYYLRVNDARSGIQGQTNYGAWTNLVSPWARLSETAWQWRIPTAIQNLSTCQTFNMRWRNPSGGSYVVSDMLKVSCGKGRCAVGGCGSSW